MANTNTSSSSESGSDIFGIGLDGVFIATAVATAVAEVTLAASEPYYNKQPQHTSALSSLQWVDELIEGHPDRMHTALGVHLRIFKALLKTLHKMGYRSSRHVQLREQLAIFLYTCVTGLSFHHVRERFQHPTVTVSKCFCRMLNAFSSSPFYTKYVSQPKATDGPLEISRNPRFYPYLANVLGALDGTHITCTPSTAEQQTARNYKGFLSQNCLMACTFDMKFTYVLSGWDGSAADAAMYYDARFHDFHIPPGKFYLADAGFAISNELLVPYRGVHYHLAKWERGNHKPNSREELYNLRHSSARNVIERTFGVLKCCFRILILPPELSMKIQVLIPPALYTIHNFIRRYDPLEIQDIIDGNEDDVVDEMPTDHQVFGLLAESHRTRVLHQTGEELQDSIAQVMWTDYNHYLALEQAASA